MLVAAILCSDLEQFPHSSANTSDTLVYGSVVTYDCDVGYHVPSNNVTNNMTELVTQYESYCNESGLWNITQDPCQGQCLCDVQTIDCTTRTFNL